MTRQTYMKNYNKAYGQTYRGIVKRIFNHQLRNCKQRNHDFPTYTEKELYDWYVSKPEHLLLHENWLKNDCNKELTPSVDRLDNNKSYSLDNIELVTWKENKTRAYTAIRANILKNPTLFHGGHKPVVQYDFNKNKVATYISIAEAEKFTNVDHRLISDVCNNKRKSAGMFLWAFVENEQQILNMTIQQIQKIRNRAISASGFIGVVHYKDGTTYKGDVMELSEHLNISAHNVRNFLKGVTSSRAPSLPGNISHFTLEYK